MPPNFLGGCFKGIGFKAVSQIAFLTGFLLLTPSIAFPQALTVKVPKGSVRAGPGLKHEIIGEVKKGEKFQAIEKKEDWYRVFHEMSGREGWIFKTIVEVKGVKSISVVSPAGKNAEAKGILYNNSWALLIGINRYSRQDLRLHYAVNDSRSIRKTLLRIGFPFRESSAFWPSPDNRPR